MNMEQLKFDLMNQFKEISKEDKVIVIIDSIGNLASLKEVEDAMNEKSVADMTRAKIGKSIFRMATPYLQMRDIPLIAIAHTYQTQEMYSKTVVSGGTGIMYAGNSVFTIGRQQDKDGTDLVGYNFIINVEKSRFVREKSKIPITVSFEGGIDKWSGLLELAISSGAVIKPSQGWYSRVNLETGELEDKKWRAKDTNTKEFWDPILAQPKFNSWIESNYKLDQSSISDEEIESELSAVNV
jgi:hypothetical protein